MNRPEDPVDGDAEPTGVIPAPPTANPARVRLTPEDRSAEQDDPDPGESGPIPAEET